MEISDEVLRKTFQSMQDDELLRRWQAQLFTDEARLIAKAEMDARGLKATTEEFDRVRLQDQTDAQAIKRRQRSTIVRWVVGLLFSIISIVAVTIISMVFGLGR